MKKINCIMLVDDDSSTSRFHQIVFESLEITEHIIFATNGKHALDYLTLTDNNSNNSEVKHVPDLILIDLNMPVMDGFRFVELYTETEHFKLFKPSIIVLSTSLIPEEKEKIEKNKNIKMFLNKPLTKDVIMNVMESFNN